MAAGIRLHGSCRCCAGVSRRDVCCRGALDWTVRLLSSRRGALGRLARFVPAARSGVRERPTATRSCP
eukprot:8196965-Alexandrium_andersonii.AAC.1